jgi:hypothetical protein
MTTAKGAPHRVKPRGPALWTLRLAVYKRDHYMCVDCGWAPDVPEGYDGRYALFEIQDRAPTRRNPVTSVTVYLELGHKVEAWRGGKYVKRNLKSQCSPCNRRTSRRAPRQKAAA